MVCGICLFYFKQVEKDKAWQLSVDAQTPGQIQKVDLPSGCMVLESRIPGLTCSILPGVWVRCLGQMIASSVTLSSSYCWGYAETGLSSGFGIIVVCCGFW